MSDRSRRLALIAVAAASGCAGGEMRTDVESTPPPAFRSADPYELGLGDEDFPRIAELADGVYAYEQIHAAGGETITTVSLFVVTSDGVLVADGQESPAETGRLLDAIAGITDRPVRHIVIASDHGDHSAGNSAFPADAIFYAHPASAAALERTAADPNRPADAPPVVLPTELVERERTLRLGGREIRILHLGPAHTGGDLVVHVPDAGVLFMSETFLNRIFPAMRSASPSGWLAMLDRALAMDVEIYVPGHGRVETADSSRRELENFRWAVSRVIEESRRLHAAGYEADEALEQADFRELWDWTLRTSQAPIAIARVYREIEGELGP